jgi:hypothetical protein
LSFRTLLRDTVAMMMIFYLFVVVGIYLYCPLNNVCVTMLCYLVEMMSNDDDILIGGTVVIIDCVVTSVVL